MKTSTSRMIVIAVAISFFLAALCLPAFSHSDSPSGNQFESIPGWMPLVWGWIAIIFIQPPAFAWLANPFFLAAIRDFYCGRYQSSMWLATTCMILGIGFFPMSSLHPMLVVFSGNGQVFYNPEPKLGFLAWMAAFFTVFFAALSFRRREKLK